MQLMDGKWTLKLARLKPGANDCQLGWAWVYWNEKITYKIPFHIAKQDYYSHLSASSLMENSSGNLN